MKDSSIYLKRFFLKNDLKKILVLLPIIATTIAPAYACESIEVTDVSGNSYIIRADRIDCSKASEFFGEYSAKHDLNSNAISDDFFALFGDDSKFQIRELTEKERHSCLYLGF